MDDNQRLADREREIAKLWIYPWYKRDIKDLEYYLERNILTYEYFYWWMFSQPDRESLRILYILVGFDVNEFFRRIVSPPPGKKPTPLAA